MSIGVSILIRGSIANCGGRGEERKRRGIVWEEVPVRTSSVLKLVGTVYVSIDCAINAGCNVSSP